MQQKVFYNVTRIENGWVLQHSIMKEATLPHRADGSRAMIQRITESYFKTLSEVLSFIDNHFQELVFDGKTTSPGVAEAKDAEVNFSKQESIGERRKDVK